MTVADSQTIDGIAYDHTNATLILEIYDHLPFDDQFEFDHLSILQDKLNSYIWFIESEQYKEIYPDKSFDTHVINIHFLDEPTDNCLRFIDNANMKLSASNIQIATFHATNT